MNAAVLRTLCVSAVLLLAAAPAAAVLLTDPPVPTLEVKTIHRMAARWANTGDPNRHTIRCRHTRTVARCRIDYYDVKLPVDVWKNGRWVAAVGDAWENVTIRRLRHRIVLTSDVFPGRLVQRG
jgi:hypothetical protein